MLKNLCSLLPYNTIYKALLNGIFCSRETSIDLYENNQSHIFKIYNYMLEHGHFIFMHK
jgi:hypothetical protein